VGPDACRSSAGVGPLATTSEIAVPCAKIFACSSAFGRLVVVDVAVVEHPVRRAVPRLGLHIASDQFGRPQFRARDRLP
jgi:hypothetical protein